MERVCPSCSAGQIACNSCAGSGVIRQDPCTVCVEGKEWIECQGCTGTGVTTVTETCLSCEGQGGYWEEEV